MQGLGGYLATFISEAQVTTQCRLLRVFMIAADSMPRLRAAEQMMSCWSDNSLAHGGRSSTWLTASAEQNHHHHDHSQRQ
jgi:hypothetical protein